MKYAEQIKSPKWQKKRLEILKRDEFTCQECGNKELTLHVHHKHYNKGAKIWEYENWELTTLCENCHNNKHNKIQPQTIIKLPHLFKFENGTQRVFDFDIYDDDEKNGLLDLLCLVKDNYDGDYLFKRLNEYFINEGFNEIDIILNKFSRLSYLEHIEGYYASKIQTLEKKINEL